MEEHFVVQSAASLRLIFQERPQISGSTAKNI